MAQPVYWVPLSDDPPLTKAVAALQRLITVVKLADRFAPNDFIAIKLHVGERRNTTHVKPELIKPLVAACQTKSENVFLTETATLYKGERENAVKHLRHAQAHGFGIEAVGAPFIMADGLAGNSEIEVAVNGELEQTVKIAREIAFCDGLIAVSHPTGHLATGLGACIKNLGMGLASRSGKLRQHSSILPEVDAAKCRACGKCITWCPEKAIAIKSGQAQIAAERCIGCAECFAVCRYDAVKYNWGIDSVTIQKSMAEHAAGVVKHMGDKCFYFNILLDMTKDCDCFDVKQPKSIPDLGILAAADPVAIDKATLDLTAQSNGKSLAELAYQQLDPLVQLNHAVKMGMGSLEYELVRVE